MQVSLRRQQRWWWWWWACLASVVSAAAGQGHCEVLDLTLQPDAYPLPTNLTVRPSATGWHLNFTLQEKGAPPAACVRLKETESKVQVMLFKGDCVHGKLKKYNYFPRASVPPHTWTTLALDVKDNIVLLTASDSEPIEVKANNWSLPRETLQVTMAHDVEAAVGCHVNCPLYRHASEGPDVKKKVGEWRQEKLNFYFRPGTAFDKVHYEVVCKTRQDSEFRRGVDIQPGKDGAAGAWHQVDLEQQESTAKVYLNDKLLEEIQLPDSCISNMHVIWTVGDASFGFDCTPKEVTQEVAKDPVTEDTPDNIMHPAVSAVITAAVLLVVIIIGIVLYKYRHRLHLQGKIHTVPQFPPPHSEEAHHSIEGLPPTTQSPAQHWENPQDSSRNLLPTFQSQSTHRQDPQYSLRSLQPVCRLPTNCENPQYSPRSLPPVYQYSQSHWEGPQYFSKSFPPVSGFPPSHRQEPWHYPSSHPPGLQPVPPHQDEATSRTRPPHIQTSDDVLGKRFARSSQPPSTESKSLLKDVDEEANDGTQ